jgi:cysteinyl-tRNA synthetase
MDVTAMTKTLRLYNTKTRTVETFKPLEKGKVGLYACGMTVYDYSHIGHGRKYTADDTLRRTLEWLGLEVKHVQNVTDVGHLVSDEDSGEDKLEKGAQKTGLDVWQTANFFTDDFYKSIELLNIKRPHIIAKATDHIEEQIEMIKDIIDNDFGYETPEAIYFDVSKYKEYTAFSGQKLEDKLKGVREDVHSGEHKRNAADFVLWFKRVGRFENHVMYWPSPWGNGFPGWHIECSAMSMKYLGNYFDIHTGGIDHIDVHHTNEIAQAYATTGKTLAEFWMHSNFLTVEGEKMSKSLENTYRVSDIINKGFSPLSLRYLYLGSHYRNLQNFTWQALEASDIALKKINNYFLSLPNSSLTNASDDYISMFQDKICDDLNTPEALAVLWKLIKDGEIDDAIKKATLLEFDKVLGLGLSTLSKEEIPQEIIDLVQRREEFRKNKDWQKSDEMRSDIEKLGYIVKDESCGPVVQKK